MVAILEACACSERCWNPASLSDECGVGSASSACNGGSEQPREVWKSLLELNPRLGQCRWLLQRCYLLEGGVHLGRCGDESRALDHSGWAARFTHEEGVLRLQLEPPVCSSRPSDDIALCVQGGVDVHTDSFRCHADHISVTLGVLSNSPWLSGFVNDVRCADSACRWDRIRCRCCCVDLVVPNDKREGLLLPTGMWQACAEGLACEECAPLGSTHVRAEPGRVFVSPQTLLVSAADLRGDALQSGPDGLVRCSSCRSVVGETQAAPANGEVARARRVAQQPARSFCREGWSRRATSCRAAGLSLYKHRVHLSQHVKQGEVAEFAPAGALNMLGAYTEESALGAQLLALRENGGPARFVLLPGPPEQERSSWSSVSSAPINAGVQRENAGEVEHEAEGVELSQGPKSAQALELRIVIPEVIMVGPFGHSDGPAETVPRRLSERTTRGTGFSPAVQRAAKVYFRQRACGAPLPECHVVVAPQDSFEAVVAKLEEWAGVLPPSHAQAPVSAGIGQAQWKTSLLPLPPRDSATE